MARPAARYVCQQCGAVHPKWAGRCEDCGAWNSLVEETGGDGPPKGLGAAKGRRIELVGLEGSEAEAPRRVTGIGEFDRVAGGGLVPGSALLVGGDPGIGKSTLLLQALKGTPRRAMELWSLSVAGLLAIAFAFYAIKLAWQSHAFNDVSTSNDATPLWIPQIGMAVGAVLLAVALIDDWVLALRGRTVERAPDAEPLRNE